MSAKSGTGIRVVNFKDFCYEPLDTTGGTNPTLYMWTAHNTRATWKEPSTGSYPYEALNGYGNYYQCDASGQSSTNWSVLKSKCGTGNPAAWANTDQAGKTYRASVQYDVAMRINSTGSTNKAGFIFQWYTFGGVHYAYMVMLDNTGLHLRKCEGADLTQEGDGIGWTEADMTSISFTPTANTFYWIRICYAPSDFTYGGRTLTEVGTFAIFVDSSHWKQGNGDVGSVTYVDESTPITAGTFLGIAGYDGGTVGFTGIEFCDEFLYRRGFPVAVDKYLMQKGFSTLVFALDDMSADVTPIDVGDRVEVWITGKDESGNRLKVCDFDGVVKQKDRRDSDRRVVYYAVDETFELTSTHRSHDPQTSELLDDYIEDNIIGSDHPATHTRGDYSRVVSMVGVDRSAVDGMEVYTTSAAWTMDCSDADMFEYSCILNDLVSIWTPEGFLVATRHIPYSFEFDTENSTTPQSIYNFTVKDDFINYYNAVIVTDKTGTESEVDSGDEDVTHKSALRLIVRNHVSTSGAPHGASAEADTIAANLKNQWMDKNPYIIIDTLNFMPQLQPGASVTVEIDSEGIDSLKMMVVEKIWYTGEWAGNAFPFPAQIVRYVLSYYDPTAVVYRRPRIPWADYETKRKMFKTLMGDRKADY